MEEYGQYNEEQFEMLHWAVNDTSSGIILFQSSDAQKQIEICNKLTQVINKKSYIINMSNIRKELLPDNITKLEKLIPNIEEIHVVILCNLQICGAELGDNEFIQKFNNMRDQMLVKKKVWVLGMSPYFSVYLSRYARDLYSCIMNQFEFKEREQERFSAFDEEHNYSIDIKLERLRFQELKQRVVLKGSRNSSTEELLQLIESWKQLYDYSDETEINWIKEILSDLQQRLFALDAKKTDVYSFVRLVLAYERFHDLTEAKKCALFIYEAIEKESDQTISKRIEIRRILADIYSGLKQYDQALDYVKMAIQILKNDKEEEYSISHIKIYELRAKILGMSRRLEEARLKYEDLKNTVIENFGDDYFYLYFIWNNLGAVYYCQGDLSEALISFNKARHILDKGWNGTRFQKINNLKNIAMVYIKLGNIEKAKVYLNKAYQLVERLDSTMKNKKLRQLDYIDNIINEQRLEETLSFSNKKEA